MQVFLETERLLLRRFTEWDVQNLVDLDSDPDVMHFLTGGAPTPPSVIEEEVLPRILAEYQRSPHFGCWAAIERPTGAFLGWFEFRPRPGGAPDEIVLGYRLRKSAWGKGYATEGSRALIRKGFTQTAARRVVADTMAVNSRSRRAMEKAGLRLVRTFHTPWTGHPIEGAEQGEVEYALGRSDWEQREAADSHQWPSQTSADRTR